MDSNFLLPGIFWMLGVVVFFLLVVTGGIVAYMFTTLFRQAASGTGKTGDEPGTPIKSGGGDAITSSKIDAVTKSQADTAKRLEALINVLEGMRSNYDGNNLMANVQAAEKQIGK